MATVLGTELEERLGVRVLVQSREGGSGSVGATFVANAEPDGYTLLHGWIAPMVVVPLYNEDVAYDPLEDFDYISHITENNILIYARKDRGWDTLADFVAEAKANPDREYSFSGSSALSILSLMPNAIVNAEELDNVTGVYYGTSPEGVLDMLAGTIDVAVSSAAALQQHPDEIVALAALNSQRIPGLEHISTIHEQGIDAPIIAGWSGILAPDGTPDEALNVLRTTMQEMLNDSDFRDVLYQATGHSVVYMDSEQFRQRVVDDREALRPIIEDIKERESSQ